MALITPNILNVTSTDTAFTWYFVEYCGTGFHLEASLSSIILNLFKSGFNLLSFSLVVKLFTSNLILFHANHTINFVINNFNGNLLSSVALRPFVSALRGVGESLILKKPQKRMRKRSNYLSLSSDFTKRCFLLSHSLSFNSLFGLFPWKSMPCHCVFLFFFLGLTSPGFIDFQLFCLVGLNFKLPSIKIRFISSLSIDFDQRLR